MSIKKFIRSLVSSLTGAAHVISVSENPQYNKHFLIETPVSGFQLHQGESVFKKLKINQPVTLRRNFDDTLDANAIDVFWQDYQIGHIPENVNCVLAQMMDRGEELEARINMLNKSLDPMQRITLLVYWVKW